MLVSVDGGGWTVAVPDGCAPSAIVGAALFPALCGCNGVRLRCNLGADVKHGPPSDEYRAVGLTSQVSSPQPLLWSLLL